MITILFGAGAEVDFGLSGGADFAKKVLGIDCEDLNDAVENYLTSIDNDYNDGWYSKYKRTNWKKENLLKAALRKKYLDEEFDWKYEYENKIEEDFKTLQNRAQDWDEIINKNTSYMNILDESFHTLINPKVLGPDIFWRVVSCYTRAYAYLMGQMRSNNTQLNITKEYRNILNNPNEAYERMQGFASEKKEESYYSIIRDKPNIRVVTTNYTTLCEKISGLYEDRVAHVHGKFGWFESAKKLQVFDVDKEDLPEDVLFPYIFIQSGVKPIVDEKQLREYAKMLNFFDESKVLFIVGYRINYDDNHINSLIRSFLKDGKKVIFFDYERLGKKNIINKLRLRESDDLECKCLEYVQIEKENCLSKFQEKLDEYQQERL